MGRVSRPPAGATTVPDDTPKKLAHRKERRPMADAKKTKAPAALFPGIDEDALRKLREQAAAGDRVVARPAILGWVKDMENASKAIREQAEAHRRQAEDIAIVHKSLLEVVPPRKLPGFPLPAVPTYTPQKLPDIDALTKNIVPLEEQIKAAIVAARNAPKKWTERPLVQWTLSAAVGSIVTLLIQQMIRWLAE